MRETRIRMRILRIFDAKMNTPNFEQCHVLQNKKTVLFQHPDHDTTAWSLTYSKFLAELCAFQYSKIVYHKHAENPHLNASFAHFWSTFCGNHMHSISIIQMHYA